MSHFRPGVAAENAFAGAGLSLSALLGGYSLEAADLLLEQLQVETCGMFASLPEGQDAPFHM